MKKSKSLNVTPAQNPQDAKGCYQRYESSPEILLVKVGNVILAQKTSRIKGALSVKFGDVAESGPEILGSNNPAQPDIDLKPTSETHLQKVSHGYQMNARYCIPIA